MDKTYYYTYDVPVPYKTIKLYPISVKDYLTFSVFAQCFTFDKNSIPDPKIISMKNLEYMYYAAEQEDEEHQVLLLWFDRLLSLSLKDERSFDNIEESILRYGRDDSGKPFFMINDNKFTSDDFEEIKAIVCEQNMIELPDLTISKEVRDSLEEARAYKNKLANSKPGTFEDYIISMATTTGWTLDYIYSISARKFLKAIRRLDNYIHYKIYLAASMSGMVTFEDRSFIKHWLTNIEDEDKYGDVSMDLSKVQDKISLESAKK